MPNSLLPFTDAVKKKHILRGTERFHQKTWIHCKDFIVVWELGIVTVKMKSHYHFRQSFSQPWLDKLETEKNLLITVLKCGMKDWRCSSAVEQSWSMCEAPGPILWRYPQLLLIPRFWERKGCSCHFALSPPLSFRTWHSVCLLPSPWTWLFQWCGGLNQINRDQGHQEDVNRVVACVMQTQESEPLEMSFRKAPDLQKDDLAQRRIQGRLSQHREAPSFIKLSGITEADLETWERLKVSGETRCALV